MVTTGAPGVAVGAGMGVGVGNGLMVVDITGGIEVVGGGAGVFAGTVVGAAVEELCEGVVCAGVEVIITGGALVAAGAGEGEDEQAAANDTAATIVSINKYFLIFSISFNQAPVNSAISIGRMPLLCS